MPIETTTASLKNLIENTPADLDAILSNRQLYQDVRVEQANALLTQRAESARSLIIRLFGEIKQDDFGTRSLSPNGEAWTLYHTRERRLAEAKEAAQRDSITPGYVEHARHRAQAIVAGLNFAQGDDFMKAYQNASTDEMRALQDYAPSLLPDGNGLRHQWVKQLERDRARRLNTPEVQAATAAMGEAVSLVYAAYVTLKNAANLFSDRLGRPFVDAQALSNQASIFRQTGGITLVPMPTLTTISGSLGEYLQGIEVITERGERAGEMLYEFRMKSFGAYQREDGVLVFGG